MSAAHAGAMLDTSIWVALFTADPVVTELMAAQGDLPSLATTMVLAELASLKERSRYDGPSPIDLVRENGHIEPMTEEDAVEGGVLHGRLRLAGHPKVSLGDCLILATARRVGALLITLDSDLAGERDVVVLRRRGASSRARRG